MERSTLSRSLKILIIEDNPDIAEMICDILNFLGHDASTVLNGGEGLAMARRQHPDIILCDIGLPGLTGYEVASRIRSDRRIGSTFMIAVTGYSMPEDIEKALAAGFNHHLAKPVDIDKLQRLLDDASATGLAVS